MVLRRAVSLSLSLVTLSTAVLLAGCSSIQSISIVPAAGSVVLTAVGQTAQFTALGVSRMGNASPTSSNITTSVAWSVTNPAVATINSAGLATAVGVGHTSINAESNGIITSSDLSVTAPSGSSGSGSGGAPTITVIPGSQAIASPGKTTQFIAIGTSPSGVTSNLTNLVTWSSSSTQIGTVGATTGLATGVGQGTTTITALYTYPSTGVVVTGTATMTVSGGTTQQFTAVSIIPGSQALSASGQTGQFIALGTAGATGLQQDVTSSPQIKWSSSSPTVASVGPTGLATGIGAGNTTVTAVLTNADGSVVSAIANVAVSLTTAPEPLLSLTVIPGSITLDNLQATGQFLAIGTFSTVPYVRDLTNSPTLTWVSSAPSVFPVNTNTAGNAGASAGIVTAYGSGTAVIIAEAKSIDGTIQTATASFNCPQALPDPAGHPPTLGTCVPGTQAPALLATLTIYNEGLSTTNWEVTGASATGTPNVIHCGPGSLSGGSVCVATYPIGTSVVLTATGSAFGGWSYNCKPSDVNGVLLNPATLTASGPNYCLVTFTPPSSTATANSNITVGAIFN